MNMAQALKYLEAYGQRQLQLFTVLEKYHQVPNSLEDLESQFHFIKEATSRNVKNLQQALNLQQPTPQPCAVTLMSFSQELLNQKLISRSLQKYS